MAEDVELIKSTMTAEDIAVLKQMLARIEGKLDQVLDLGLMDAEPAEPELEAADDFAEANMVELPIVAHRFGIAKDKLRRWCRDYGIGVLQGGRWMVSIPRIRRHLGKR
ncbi:UNVERIFIED_ORG: hypothetical protein GGI66_003674 [Rhizobium esperanzae]